MIEPVCKIPSAITVLEIHHSGREPSIYNLLIRSFSRAETIFGSKGRDVTMAECLPDPLTPLGALPHILFPWILTLNGHRVIYGVGRTGGLDRHHVIYGVGQ